MGSIVYRKDGHTFIFRWTVGDEEHIINDLVKKASEGTFAWHDAAACSRELGVWLSRQKRGQQASGQQSGSLS